MKNETIKKLSLVAVLSLLPVALAFAQPNPSPALGVIPGKYIVVLKAGADRAAAAARHAVLPDFVYTHALNVSVLLTPSRAAVFFGGRLAGC